MNLETGMPTAADAIRRLERRVDTARRQGIKVLKVIHGYGSSGRGGKLREAVRRALPDLERQGRIAGHVAGEQFSKRSALVRRYPWLQDDRDLGRCNEGITLVALR